MSNQYTEDILKNGFEQLTIPLTRDYEGEASATLIRRKSQIQTDKAVLYIHGFNDYFFQKEMGTWFNQINVCFYALDLRKYGRSHLPHQKFNDVRNLKDYYEEISESLRIIRSEGYLTTTLLGHSTGGLIVSLYAKDHPKSALFDGVILNSPFFKFNLAAGLRKILPVITSIGKILPSVKISGGFTAEYGKSLHKDHYGEWDYNLNWKPHIPPKVNLGWIRAIYDAQKDLKPNFEIDKSILILHSDKSIYSNNKNDMQKGDAILNVNDINTVARTIKGDVQISVINDGVHDLILSRLDIRDIVYSVMTDWLKKHRLS